MDLSTSFVNENFSVLKMFIGLLLLSIIGVSTYRLYLSPLAKIPGPKLAGLTSWYEFYYDVVKGGQYTFHIQDLHRTYGPIVRINPTEVHIDDPEYYETIYSHNLHLDKLQSFNIRWDQPGSMQVTGPHAHHRILRKALNPFFSKSQIITLWPYILEKGTKLSSILESTYCDNKTPLNLTKAYGCFGLDVLTEYAFSSSFNHLSRPEFESELLHVVDYLTTKVHLVTHLPFLRHMMKALPRSVQEVVEPGMVIMNNYHDMIEEQVRQVMKSHDEKKDFVGHKTIFSEIIESDLPAADKKIERLADEAGVMTGAATDTIKNALTVASFHILNEPEIYTRLVEELIAAMPDRDIVMTWAELERLPYLTAIIQEALRLSYGVTQRSPRFSPTEVIQYKNFTIPPGYAIGMDPVHMHHNEDIFPDSYQFKPERWLGDPAAMKKLQRYNIAFSRGTRQCVGMNLAWAEMYLLLSTVFRRFDMELWETDARCVKVEADFFVPKMKNKEGLKVMIRRRDK